MLLDCTCVNFTVELEEDVDDSRTGSKPFCALVEAAGSLLLEEARLRVGLAARGCEVPGAVANAPDAYDEAELGVGT